MSNFTNSQKSRATNTNWRSRSHSVGSKPYNPLPVATSSSTVDYSNTANISNKQHPNRPNLPKRTASVTTSSTSSSSMSRSYFAHRLSSDSNSDGGYLWLNKDRHNSNNYSHRHDQRMSNKQLRDPSQSSSASTSSAESGIFSGDNSGGNINPANSSNINKDRNKHLNFPPNHRNGNGFNRYPPGMPIPTPAAHFASSQSFNAPAASSLPQPPQIWLFGRAEALVKEEDLEEERQLEKSLNTFDYYNLKMLLSGEA